MAGVLTEGSRIACATNGAVSATGEAKLKVAGNPVLVLAGVAGKSVGSCTTVTDTNTGSKQCATVAAVTGGQATKLTVGNAPVLLDTLAGTADGIHPPPKPAALSAQANQTTMTAV
ncbi:MAG: hypothetical protein WBA97_13725 [Actinophytocola sp.]|uniref:hypothetical protein n=1 Tax=Actinophytocola sp. TaxID=1872138 RepID=UPI003C7688F7